MRGLTCRVPSRGSTIVLEGSTRVFFAGHEPMIHAYASCSAAPAACSPRHSTLEKKTVCDAFVSPADRREIFFTEPCGEVFATCETKRR